MRKSLIKNNFKAIIKTRRRFISMLIMAFLGVGFFAGLVASSPDILDSLDKYVDESKLFDIDVISTLGLTDEDVKEIGKIEGVESVYGLQTKDSVVEFNNKESICKVIEYNENINRPTVIEGRLPETTGECVLDSRYSIDEDLKNYIGKTIKIVNDDTDEDDNQIFTEKELTIVGIVDSPLYISTQRGNTSIGNGNIGFYVYTTDDVIKLDYYTEICVTVKGAEEVVTNSDEYLNLVNPIIEQVEAIKAEREEARYNELVNEANSKIDDAQKEYDEKKADVEKELQEAEDKINDAKKEIADGEKEIEKAEAEITSQESKLKKEIASAETKLKNAEKEIQENENLLKTNKEEFEKNKKEANTALEQIKAGITTAENTIQELQSNKKVLEQMGQDTTEIDVAIATAQAKVSELEKQQTEIQNQLEQGQKQIEEAEAQINSAKKELQTQEKQLESTKNISYKKINNAKAEIKENKAKLEDAKKELEENETEFNDKKKEAEEQFEDAQKEIDDAREEVKKIEKAKWYIQDRLDNTGYTNVFDAIKTMSNIAKLFPVIFYLVAVLISLTSMTRMIEEERIEIGTLKALGYTNLQIISKYVLYAFLACVIGGVLGMSVGFYLLPNIVWSLYSIIYTIPKFYTMYRLETGLIGIIIAFVCIGGATIIVANKELKQYPSVLMRPKSPKNGKRIFLERIGIIWKRLNFSQKVTMRNIFRYKKRALMTIVGIAGCTGLMLTGFGIKDSVVDIPNAQFGGVFKYETMVSLLNTENLDELEEYLNTNEKIENYSELYASTGKLKNDDLDFDVTIFVPEETENLKYVCNLENVENGEELTITDNGIIITDKVADSLNVKPGDEITLLDSDDIEYKFKVDGITRNYIGHYVYMSKELFETNMKKYETNMILLNIDETKDETGDDVQNAISEEILKFEGVASVSIVSSLVKSVADMLNTMNYVVVVLIVASALLAFVVLYNLANINIGERQREIATLKVLGFYNKEVDNYINKENIIFTIIGVALGLVFGTFLTSAIIGSIEIDNLRFMRNILPISYVYSTVITLAFSFIVNFFIHFILKKINMIDSLKSVE